MTKRYELAEFKAKAEEDRGTPWEELPVLYTVRCRNTKAAHQLATSILGTTEAYEVRWQWKSDLQVLGHYVSPTLRSSPPVPEHLTREQVNLLGANTHLLAVSTLEDGDLLVLDTSPTSPDVFPDGHFGPYVLTTEGHLQDVNYHYREHHLLDVPHSHEEGW